MNRYITTTLPYVNADPHLGHALEFVQADAYVRALRAKGEEVFFNIGTDEHGAKIAQIAAEKGKIPQEFVDFYAARFVAFAKRLAISNDVFLRTTDPAHKAAATEMWRRCAAAGDIYKATYEVKYCVGCELEKTDSELVEGKCPLHPNMTIEVRNEENYFFRFSKHEEALLKLYRERPEFVVPRERLGEIKSFVGGGLKDFSISRPSERLSWGVPVPGDESHVMYVWFDALTSYLSALGWPDNQDLFQKWWPVTHFAGKDNLRQQSAMFQAMLLSAGIKPSTQVFIHGFITSGGQKMSKSLGNVIDPMGIADAYGVDALRYILLRHVHPFEDSDLTEANIHAYYTAHLVNGLGNLVARVMTLAEAHIAPVELANDDTMVESAFSENLEAFKFNEAMDLVWEHIAKGDAYMTEKAPYRLIKTDPDTAKKDIEKLVRHLAKLAMHLAPVMPATSEIILHAVRTNKKPKNLFPRL